MLASASYNVIKKSIYQWTEQHSNDLYDYGTPNNAEWNDKSEKTNHWLYCNVIKWRH